MEIRTLRPSHFWLSSPTGYSVRKSFLGAGYPGPEPCSDCCSAPCRDALSALPVRP